MEGSVCVEGLSREFPLRTEEKTTKILKFWPRFEPGSSPV
jgi:hypothetical protein